MTMKIAGLYAVGVGSGSIGQIQSQNINFGVRDYILSGSGVVDARFAAILAQDPTFGFTSQAIKTALDLVSIDGAAITGSNKLALYFELFAQGGIKQAGSVHTKITADGGLLYPTSINAGQDQPASIAYDCMVVDINGTGDAPFTKSTSALAGTPHDDECWTLGPVSIGGTTLAGLQSVTINFGIGVRPVRSDGLVFPTFASIVSRNPTVTLRGVDAAVLDTISASGTSMASGAVVRLRKVVKHGTVHTSQGLSFTIATGLAFSVSASGQHAQEHAYDVTLRPTKSGNDSIFVIGTY